MIQQLTLKPKGNTWEALSIRQVNTDLARYRKNKKRNTLLKGLKEFELDGNRVFALNARNAWKKFGYSSPVLGIKLNIIDNS